MKELGVDLRKARLEVEKLVKSGPDMITMGTLPQTPRAKKVIAIAIEESRKLGHDYVGTEHILLGLIGEHGGIAVQVLLNLGLKLEDVKEEVLALISKEEYEIDPPDGDVSVQHPPAKKTFDGLFRAADSSLGIPSGKPTPF